MSSDENGDGGPADAWQRLSEKVDRVRTSVEELASQESAGELRRALDLEGRARRHPYGLVAAAFGIGFVVGGGLFTPLGKRIARTALRLGLRASALPFIERELVALVSGGEGPRRPRTKGGVP